MSGPSNPPNTEIAMRVVCAWCRAELRGGPEIRVTHGICIRCKDEFERGCCHTVARATA